MPYTFIPKQKHAKAYTTNQKISTKSAEKICNVIKKKPLKRVKSLLIDLSTERRNLKGKYYSNSVSKILDLLESCEKNAEFLGLDNEKLFVHASATAGSIIRRRRRKSSYGSRMKSTNVEIMLIEKGKSKKIKETTNKELRDNVEKVNEKLKYTEIIKEKNNLKEKSEEGKLIEKEISEGKKNSEEKSSENIKEKKLEKSSENSK